MKNIILLTIALISTNIFSQTKGMTYNEVKSSLINKDATYIIGTTDDGTRFFTEKDTYWSGEMPDPVMINSHHYVNTNNVYYLEIMQFLNKEGGSKLSESYARIYYAFAVQFFATYNTGENTIYSHKKTEDNELTTSFKRPDGTGVKVYFSKRDKGGYSAYISIELL